MMLVTGLSSYKFGFRSSVQKNGPPGEGRHEGLVPRNDVPTNGFIRFSPARTLARILFVSTALAQKTLSHEHHEKCRKSLLKSIIRR